MPAGWGIAVGVIGVTVSTFILARAMVCLHIRRSDQDSHVEQHQHPPSPGLPMVRILALALLPQAQTPVLHHAHALSVGTATKLTTGRKYLFGGICIHACLLAHPAPDRPGLVSDDAFDNAKWTGCVPSCLGRPEWHATLLDRIHLLRGYSFRHSIAHPQMHSLIHPLSHSASHSVTY